MKFSSILYYFYILSEASIDFTMMCVSYFIVFIVLIFIVFLFFFVSVTTLCLVKKVLKIKCKAPDILLQKQLKIFDDSQKLPHFLK